MKCSQCQFENVSDTRFCGNCAALLRPDRPAPTPSSPPSSPASPPPLSPFPSPASFTPPISSTRTVRVPCGEIAPGSAFAGRCRICDELGRGGMGRAY
jgi:hypothetical protein